MHHDVLIIGGSYAGLSAAMALGRARRNVLIVDSGQPCNRQTPHSHNFLTRDGEKPAEIARIAWEQVSAYPTVARESGMIVRVSPAPGGFEAESDTGTLYTSRKLILAYGVKDHLPAIPGFADSWGITTLHCPYCHGYEVRSRPLGIFGNGDVVYEFTKLLTGWSNDLRLLTNGPATLTPEQRQELERHGIPVIEHELAAIAPAPEGQELRFANGDSVSVAALFARVQVTLPNTLAQELGCDLTPAGLIKTDELRRTNVPGVYAAGDAAIPMRSVSAAVASGTLAAGMLNHELAGEDFAR